MSFYALDMETLGISESSIILSIGVVAIKDDITIKTKDDLNKVSRLFIQPNLIEQEKRYKRTTDVETIYWWLSQNPNILEEQVNGLRISCQKCYKSILNFLDNHGFFDTSRCQQFIWSRGLIDSYWWNSLCNNLNKDNYLPYWRWLDSRTACNVLGINQCLVDLFDLKKNNPVDECLIDYLLLTQQDQTHGRQIN